MLNTKEHSQEISRKFDKFIMYKTGKLICYSRLWRNRLYFNKNNFGKVTNMLENLKTH